MRLLRILLLLALPAAADPATDDPASLVPEGKLVLAHYMTKMVPSPEGEAVWSSPELHDPEGSTAALGGLYLTLPMASVLKPDMTLEQAVEFEIRAAKQLGLDGFQFYYPLYFTEKPLLDYNRIVRAFLRAAEQRHPGFKVSLCLSVGGRSGDLNEAGRIALWGDVICELLSDTRDSPAWLRTRQGSLLFFHWVTAGLSEQVRHRAQTADQVAAVADCFERVAERAGEPIDWVYHVLDSETPAEVTDAILDHFPAIWGWVNSAEDPAFWDALAQRCQERGVAYTQTVYPDYFTSKVYPKGESGYRLLSVKESLELGAEGVERHYRQTDLAREQVGLLQAAQRREAQMINYATWNDWPEGHHLAPEANHNFGPSILLRHFVAEWRGEKPPFEDFGILFYKKHPSTATPDHEIAVKVKSARDEPAAEDGLQLVTWLEQPAACRVQGTDRGRIEAGFQITDLPAPEEGPIQVELVDPDSGEVWVAWTSPVGVERQPGRTDRLTYSHSSRFEEEFRPLFGADAEPPRPAPSP